MRQAGLSHPDLTNPAPETTGGRLALFAARRMAIYGLKDAHAVHALLGGFGKGYRRPLVLVRAMMLELARASTRTILMAPCCCPRLTSDETLLMEVLISAGEDPHGCHERLKALLDVPQALGALTCAQAVAQAFEDLGQPLGQMIPIEAEV